MFASPILVHYPFVLRIGLLLVLVFLTVRYTKRGIQNGVLVGLITGMSPHPIVLFWGWELLPGLPNVISLDRIVWPIVLAIFYLKRSRGETERIPLDGIERGLLIFVAVILVSMISHGSYIDSDGEWNLFKIVRGYAFPFIAYFIVRRAAATTEQLRTFLVGVGFLATYLVFTGIAETFGIRQLVFPQFILDPGLGSHAGRPRGMFLNASAYGFAISAAVPILVRLYSTDRSPRRYLWALVGVLSAIPLIYTFQRAAWLGAIVALGVTLLASPKLRVTLTGVLVFSALCGFWFGSEALTRKLESQIENQRTIDYRLAHIERGLAIFRENPIFGVGIGRYGVEAAKDVNFRSVLTQHAHNTWITLLAELGLVGFVTYLIPFIVILLKSVTHYLRFPQYRAILGVVLGVTLAFLGMSISIEMRGQLYENTLLFTLWSMLLGGQRRQLFHVRPNPTVPHHRRVLGGGIVPIRAPRREGQFSCVPRSRVARCLSELPLPRHSTQR